MPSNITEYDVFYISYDEPNAEENWADLQNKCPWAQRVHGVKGFDAAHKECANLSSTDRFVTVDGDNIVDEKFFDLVLNIENPQYHGCTFSWSGYNIVNGLTYGNGGLKLWDRLFVQKMKTHENADTEGEAIDFCWKDKYIQVQGCYSYTHINGSPLQAFRAGFREGVKMSLNEGHKVENKKFMQTIWPGNIKWLSVWASIGADCSNGLWSIYGTRLGCQMINFTDWNHHLVRDYDWFNDFWLNEISRKFIGSDQKCKKTKYSWSESKLNDEILKLGNQIRSELKLNIAELNPVQSKFFKTVYESIDYGKKQI